MSSFCRARILNQPGAVSRVPVLVIGFLLLPAVWLALKYMLSVSDRYLPAPAQVFGAFSEIEPNIMVHVAYTSLRLVIGFVAGVVAGIALGIALSKSKTAAALVGPVLGSMRSVPPIAIIPFFLLWFGFSEVGRLLLVLTGIAFNIAISTYQVLQDIPEKHRILFKSFGLKDSDMTVDYSLPRILESLLPTVRFSLSTAMGVVIASELLGSQVGLGYLMQTARNTFSMHVIFLATILLGIMNAVMDFTLVQCWRRATYWR
jgi:ABC-type nitrate/sulfonate/bicarbonate transport system permease component